jgi:hypothetical protein
MQIEKDLKAKLLQTMLVSMVLWIITADLGLVISSLVSPNVSAELSLPKVAGVTLLALSAGSWTGWPIGLFRYREPPIPITLVSSVPMLVGIVCGPAFLILHSQYPESLLSEFGGVWTAFAVGFCLGPIFSALMSNILIYSLKYFFAAFSYPNR